LAKELYTVDTHFGYDTMIPQELSQKHLPMSFRYYDPILVILKQSMPKELEDLYAIQMELFQKSWRNPVERF